MCSERKKASLCSTAPLPACACSLCWHCDETQQRSWDRPVCSLFCFTCCGDEEGCGLAFICRQYLFTSAKKNQNGGVLWEWRLGGGESAPSASLLLSPLGLLLPPVAQPSPCVNSVAGRHAHQQIRHQAGNLQPHLNSVHTSCSSVHTHFVARVTINADLPLSGTVLLHTLWSRLRLLNSRGALQCNPQVHAG